LCYHLPVTDQLRAALLANKDAVAAAISQAEAELARCQQRCEELAALIERARLVLDLDHPTDVEPLSRMTLHQAMGVVLAEHHEGLRARALAEEVNRRRLYRRKDGRPIDPVQVHARAGAYTSLFARRDGRIMLRDSRPS